MWPHNEFFDLNQFACRRRDFVSSNDAVSKKLALLDSIFFEYSVSYFFLFSIISKEIWINFASSFNSSRCSSVLKANLMKMIENVCIYTLSLLALFIIFFYSNKSLIRKLCSIIYLKKRERERERKYYFWGFFLPSWNWKFGKLKSNTVNCFIYLIC